MALAQVEEGQAPGEYLVHSEFCSILLEIFMVIMASLVVLVLIPVFDK